MGSARIGVGTPQANPTVEAEFRVLLPRDVDYVTTRLVSPSPSSRQRLLDYLTGLRGSLEAFGGLRLDAFCFACTGSSYLAGPAVERQVLAGVAGFGYPVITATAAIEARLKALGAKRLALVAPYPPWLLEAGVAWWQGRGFVVQHVHRVATRSAEDTTTIYELTSADAVAALAQLGAAGTAGADVVLFSGTGMPSAEVLDEAMRITGLPVVSSNSALVHETLRLLGRTPS